MENTAKNLILVFLCSLTVVCKAERPEQATKSVTADIHTGHSGSEEKRALGEGLYRDGAGSLFLKVKNRAVMHPSRFDEPVEDSIYLQTVYVFPDSETVALNEILHVETFRRVNISGTYFADSAHIYVYSAKPHSVQFFALSRRGARFLGTHKDYLLYQKLLYFQGEIVDGMDTDNLTIISYPKQKSGGDYEFITDDSSVYFEAYPMNRERLKWLDLSEENKRDVVNRFGPLMKTNDGR